MLTRAEWLTQRGSFVGASEIASILGLPGAYGTMADVYVSKIKARDESEDAAVEFDDPEMLEKFDRKSIGLLVEPAILGMYEIANPSLTIHRNGLEIKRHPKYPFIGATRDAYAVSEFGDKHTVEAKNVTVFKRQEWGIEGTDEVPASFAAQGVQQMLVCADEGFGTFCDFAVFFGGNDFKVFSVQYDAKLAAQIIDVLSWFWNLVETRTPPDVDFSRQGAAKLLRQIYSKIVGETITASPDAGLRALRLILRRDIASESIKRWEAEKEEATAKLLSIAGDFGRVEIPVTVNGKNQVVAINRKPKKGYDVAYSVEPSVALSFEPYHLAKRAQIFEALEITNGHDQLDTDAAAIEGETDE